jgi:hypothetical protein
MSTKSDGLSFDMYKKLFLSYILEFPAWSVERDPSDNQIKNWWKKDYSYYTAVRTYLVFGD